MKVAFNIFCGILFWFVLILIQTEKAYSQGQSALDLIKEAKSAMSLFNYKKANELSVEAINYAEDEDNNDVLLEAFFIAGNSDRLIRNYTSSLNHYLQAESLNNKLNDGESKIRLNREMGDLFLDWGVPDKALIYYSKSIGR